MRGITLLCFVFLAFIAGGACASPATGQTVDRWEATLKASSFYDSQLVIEQTDISRQSGDSGLKLGVNLAFKPVVTQALDVKIAYDLGQTLYSEFEGFNIQTHHVDASVTRQIRNVRIGLRADATHVRLASDPFLDLLSVSPSVGILVRKDIFVRGHVLLAEKHFDDFQGHDAKIRQGGVNLFRFHEEGRGYVVGSATIEREDAVDPSFDFDGVNGSVTVRHPLGSRKNAPSLKLMADYRARAYSSVTPSIGKERSEKRYRIETELVFNLKSNLQAKLNYRFTDRNSNLVSANYTEHRSEVGLALRL